MKLLGDHHDVFPLLNHLMRVVLSWHLVHIVCQDWEIRSIMKLLGASSSCVKATLKWSLTWVASRLLLLKIYLGVWDIQNYFDRQKCLDWGEFGHVKDTLLHYSWILTWSAFSHHWHDSHRYGSLVRFIEFHCFNSYKRLLSALALQFQVASA